ncbi:MAG: helix-turn-helix transcriptional regulator [Clostridium sp.]
MGDDKMEILSTGEKIKRARVYKGFTLKDLCEDKISVSKMSCIENNKIKSDLWILEFVGSKLGLDLEYLKKDVDEQLEENLSRLKKEEDTENYEKDLKTIISYSEKYTKYSRAFEAMHILFQYYFKNKNTYKLQDIQCEYYDLYEKAYNEKNQILYYMDIALYLHSNDEIVQSMNYYDKIYEILSTKTNLTSEERDTYGKVIYNQANAYLVLGDNENSYRVGVELKEFVDYISDNVIKSKVYCLLANVAIKNKLSSFSKYEKKSYEHFEENSYEIAKIKNSYAEKFFEVGLKDKAIFYIDEALAACPKDEKFKLVDLLLEVVKNLLDSEFSEKAEDICDVALNEAIALNNIRFIEKAYYYKALLCMKISKECFADVYMNLSLDFIAKFGSKKQVYERYLELGNMYNKLNNIKESLKYFGLAVAMEEKL